ncbi:hypothetical protein NKI54_23850 [Mesorhizobium sp. M0663]|uniref:hypothetical protein n=1 Tax=unclassified Mesorhizobium TaxID=325217 RepID=UPI00333661E4
MILDFGGGFFLRRATTADHAALAMICLKTGDAGKDASGREDDPELLGLLYTIPYQVLEPELAFIIDSPAGAAGYLLGAADTGAFNASLASDWYPDFSGAWQTRDPTALAGAAATGRGIGSIIPISLFRLR